MTQTIQARRTDSDDYAGLSDESRRLATDLALVECDFVRAACRLEEITRKATPEEIAFADALDRRDVEIVGRKLYGDEWDQMKSIGYEPDITTYRRVSRNAICEARDRFHELSARRTEMTRRQQEAARQLADNRSSQMRTLTALHKARRQAPPRLMRARTSRRVSRVVRVATRLTAKATADPDPEPPRRASRSSAGGAL